jgi:uncharacterized membrane protein
MKKRSTILAVYLFSLIGIFIWLGIIFLAPYLRNHNSGWNVLFYSILSPVCHQIPSRSFFLFGYPLAVCGRCLGIYFGFIIGTLMYPLLKGLSNTTLPKTKTFILFSLPIIFDTLGNFLRIWMTPNLPRFIIGFLWGLIFPFYFIPGITDFFLTSVSKKRNRSEKHLEIET